MAQFADDLQHDPVTQAKVQAAKDRVLAREETRRALADPGQGQHELTVGGLVQRVVGDQGAQMRDRGVEVASLGVGVRDLPEQLGADLAEALALDDQPLLEGRRVPDDETFEQVAAI